MMPPRVPVSLEVLEHHYAGHPCEGWREVLFDCSCDSSVLALCSKCGQWMTLWIKHGSWCEHAAAAWADATAPPPPEVF
jgi:hypothetical protein